MYSPKINERVFVRPTNPNEAVQRGIDTFGQFLTNGWQEVLFNEFLHARLVDGSIEVRPRFLPQAEAPKEPSSLPSPSFFETPADEAIL